MKEKPESLIEKAQVIYSRLPKQDCFNCGYRTCELLAMAIVAGDAYPDLCKKLDRDQTLMITQIV